VETVPPVKEGNVPVVERTESDVEGSVPVVERTEPDVEGSVPVVERTVPVVAVPVVVGRVLAVVEGILPVVERIVPDVEGRTCAAADTGAKIVQTSTARRDTSVFMALLRVRF
jgi:hypothetical protein